MRLAISLVVVATAFFIGLALFTVCSNNIEKTQEAYRTLPMPERM